MNVACRGNCCETCRCIPQKIPMKQFVKNNSLTRHMLFRECYSEFLKIKEIIDEVAVGSLCLLFKAIILIYL